MWTFVHEQVELDLVSEYLEANRARLAEGAGRHDLDLGKMVKMLHHRGEIIYHFRKHVEGVIGFTIGSPAEQFSNQSTLYIFQAICDQNKYKLFPSGLALVLEYGKMRDCSHVECKVLKSNQRGIRQTRKLFKAIGEGANAFGENACMFRAELMYFESKLSRYL